MSFLIPATKMSEVEGALESIKDEHPTATHHCYAFRINPAEITEFSQDDGEPSGTAGAPILNALKSHSLINVICVVVRYYGGTKLGKSGLIEAYGEAAEHAIEKSTLKKLVPTRQFSISYPYSEQSEINTLKHRFTLFEIDATYTDTVSWVVECPISESKKFKGTLQSIEHLLLSVEVGGTSYQIIRSL